VICDTKIFGVLEHHRTGTECLYKLEFCRYEYFTVFWNIPINKFKFGGDVIMTLIF
jgi:hypothetical protein